MWELYAFWGRIGPFLVSAALTAGMGPDEAVKWGGTGAAAIILIGAPATWVWGIAADRKGRTWAIIVASLLSVAAECFPGFLYGDSCRSGLAGAAGSDPGSSPTRPSTKRGSLRWFFPGFSGHESGGLQSVVGFFVTIISPLVFGKILEEYNGSVPAAEAKVWGPAFLVLGLGGARRRPWWPGSCEAQTGGLMAGGKEIVGINAARRAPALKINP